MKISDKIQFLQENHFSKWVSERQSVENQLSVNQPLICVCGSLATGLHESRCAKFKNAVNTKTVSNLKHLIQ